MACYVTCDWATDHGARTPGNNYSGAVNKLPSPPPSLLPADGRFGAGPSLIRSEQTQALAHASELGTSHRKPPVKARVGSIRDGLSALFSLPDGFEIVLGNGGATAFWPIMAASLARDSVKAAVFGEFGAKAAADLGAAPWLDMEMVKAPAGELAEARDDIPFADLYIYPENETSTGVLSPLYRGAPGDALTAVDATSIAGAHSVDWDLVDVYYFSPQKALGSDGGLWLAVLSPAAQERALEMHALMRAGDSGNRYMPSFLDLAQALRNSKSDQTLNTPAISTLILLDEQIQWLLEQGGLARAAKKSKTGADMVAAWANTRPYASMFVQDPALRSPVVSTVDLIPELPAAEVAAALRAVGVVDIEGYRKLGRNQLRIASFPSIATEDIAALLASIDWIAESTLT